MSARQCAPVFAVGIRPWLTLYVGDNLLHRSDSFASPSRQRCRIGQTLFRQRRLG
jgi:hypothetical protein